MYVYAATDASSVASLDVYALDDQVWVSPFQTVSPVPDVSRLAGLAQTVETSCQTDMESNLVWQIGGMCIEPVRVYASLIAFATSYQSYARMWYSMRVTSRMLYSLDVWTRCAIGHASIL